MKAVMVGWGHTRFGRLEAGFEQMIHAVTREALTDAGLSGADVDAVWLGHFNAGMVSDGFASSMILSADEGLRFKPATRCENACASGSAALYAAMDAVAAGRADVCPVPRHRISFCRKSMQPFADFDTRLCRKHPVAKAVPAAGRGGQLALAQARKSA